MAINIPSEIERRAREAAARQGIDADTFVAEAVKKELFNLEDKEMLAPQDGGASEVKTLADLFEGLIGGFRSGRGDERLSENTGEKFTDYLVQKREEDRL